MTRVESNKEMDWSLFSALILSPEADCTYWLRNQLTHSLSHTTLQTLFRVWITTNRAVNFNFGFTNALPSHLPPPDPPPPHHHHTQTHWLMHSEETLTAHTDIVLPTTELIRFLHHQLTQNSISTGIQVQHQCVCVFYMIAEPIKSSEPLW